MEKMKLEIIVKSATGLHDVKKAGKVRVFATAYLTPAHITTMQRTKADMFGETNPVWNANMTFSITQADLLNETLNFGLFSGANCFGYIGVHLSALRATAPSSSYTEVSYPVGTGSGKLNFSYRFMQEGMLPDQVAVDSSSIGSTRGNIINDGGWALSSSSTPTTTTRMSGGFDEDPSYLKNAKIVKELANEGLQKTADAVPDGTFTLPDLGDVDFDTINTILEGVLGSTRANIINDGGWALSSSSSRMSGGFDEDPSYLKYAKIMKELANEGLQKTADAIRDGTFTLPDLGDFDFDKINTILEVVRGIFGG